MPQLRHERAQCLRCALLIRKRVVVLRRNKSVKSNRGIGDSHILATTSLNTIVREADHISAGSVLGSVLSL